jgi:hypothetical protein
MTAVAVKAVSRILARRQHERSHTAGRVEARTEPAGMHFGEHHGQPGVVHVPGVDTQLLIQDGA